MELVAAPSRHRRDRVPRARHPVEPGAAAARRRVLSRPRPRTHRRVPRAPGRALRARPRPRSPTRPASRSSPRPSSRSRSPTTRARRRSARPDASATPSANRAVAALAHLWHDAAVPDRPRAARDVSRSEARGLRARVAIACAAGGRVRARPGSRPPTPAPTPAGARRRCARRCGRPAACPPSSTRAVESAAQARAGGRAHAAARRRSSRPYTRASRSTVRPARSRASTPTRALAPASTLKLLTGDGRDRPARRRPSLHDPRRRSTPPATSSSSAAAIRCSRRPSTSRTSTRKPRFRDAPFTPLAGAGRRDRRGRRARRQRRAARRRPRCTTRCASCPDWKPVYAQEGDIGVARRAHRRRRLRRSRTARSPRADPALDDRPAPRDAARGARRHDRGRRRGAASRRPARTRSRTSTRRRSRPSSARCSRAATTTPPRSSLRDLAVDPHGNDARDHRPRARRSSRSEMTAARRPDRRARHARRLGPRARRPRHVRDAARRSSSSRRSRGSRRSTRASRSRAQTGTLAERFVGDPLAGKLRAKTGSIDGVVGLVGVIDGPDDLHFAFLANGDFSTATGDAAAGRGRDRGRRPRPTSGRPPTSCPRRERRGQNRRYALHREARARRNCLR